MKPSRLGFGILLIALAVAAPPRLVLRPASAANGDDWFRLQRAYPAGQPAPATALANAVAGWRRAGDGIRPRLDVPGERWTSIGPQPIGTANGLTYAGRITAIAPHPTDANTLYVASNSGGIWKTTNLGNSWTALVDTLAYPAMASIAVDPVDPSLIYAVTMARSYPARLLRSTNAGATWTESPITTTTGQSLVFAGKIIVDPARAGSPNTSTVYVSGFSNVLRSDDSGRTWRSVLQLAPDQDFTSVTTARLASAPTIRDLTTDPASGDTLYVVVAEPACADANCAQATATMALYRTFNAGTSWTRSTLATAGRYAVPNRRHTEIYGPYTPRARVVVAKSNPRVVAVAFLDDGLQLPRVLRSTSGGDAFTETAAVPRGGGFVWPITLAISPTNADDMLIGNWSIIRTGNGGAAWTTLGAPHGDQTVIAFTAGGTVVVGNDGGMYRLSGTSTFIGMNAGLSITESYSVATHPSNPLMFVSGTQDNGGIQFRGPLGWSIFHGGDGGDMVFDPSPSSITLYSEIEWFFDPFSGNNVYQFYRCTLNGGCQLRNTGFDLSDNGPFIPRMVIDRTRPESLWLTAERMYRTDNRGDLWAGASPKISTTRCGPSSGSPAVAVCAAAGYFTAVAVSASNSDIVFAGALNGDIWKTTNRGITWQSVAGTVAAPLPVRPVTDIQIDPTDAQTAYATYSGFDAARAGAGHVFRTRNGGQTWTDITGGLPDLPVNTLLIDPDSSTSTTPRVVYVGTDIGVYRLVDDGAAGWQPFASGMPFVPVTDIVYNPTTRMLVAATYGRGLWTISTRFVR